jgi:hypothetical protein
MSAWIVPWNGLVRNEVKHSWYSDQINLWNSRIQMPSGRPTAAHKEKEDEILRYSPVKKWAPKRSHQKHQNIVASCDGGDTKRSDSENDTLCQLLLCSSMYTLLMKGDREESPLITIFFLQTALDLGNRHFPLSRAALIGVLTWCVGSVGPNIFQQNSSRPDARLQPPAWVLCFAPKTSKLVTENRETPWMPLKIAIRMRRFDWPAVARLPLSVWYLSLSKIMRYLQFRAFPVVPYVQSTTVSLCKTLNEILVTPSILQCSWKAQATS